MLLSAIFKKGKGLLRPEVKRESSLPVPRHRFTSGAPKRDS